MKGNGKGPMDNGAKTGRQLGYCSGYKNAGFENIEFGNKGCQNPGFGFGNGRRGNAKFGNRNRNNSLGRRFIQGFSDDIEYTQVELLNLKKSVLQAELKIIEEKLKDL